VLPETRITVCLQGCSVSTPIPASTAQFNAFRETPRSKDDLSPFGKFYRVVK
jgi:hypothetical protein